MNEHSTPTSPPVLTALGSRRIICAAVFSLSVVALFFLARASASAGLARADAANAYHEEIAKNYDFKFGANPFLPSNATTATGKFIPAEMFISADRCAKCHTDSHAQWLQSAHRNAFREPFYQKNVKD